MIKNIILIMNAMSWFGGKVNATNKIVDKTSTITIVSICIYRTETGQEIKRKFTRRTQQFVYVGFFTSRPVQVRERERNLVRINEKLLQDDFAGILNKYSKIKWLFTLSRLMRLSLEFQPLLVIWQHCSLGPDNNPKVKKSIFPANYLLVELSLWAGLVQVSCRQL